MPSIRTFSNHWVYNIQHSVLKVADCQVLWDESTCIIWERDSLLLKCCVVSFILGDEGNTNAYWWCFVCYALAKNYMVQENIYSSVQQQMQFNNIWSHYLKCNSFLQILQVCTILKLYRANVILVRKLCCMNCRDYTAWMKWENSNVLSHGKDGAGPCRPKQPHPATAFSTKYNAQCVKSADYEKWERNWPM